MIITKLLRQYSPRVVKSCPQKQNLVEKNSNFDDLMIDGNKKNFFNKPSSTIDHLTWLTFTHFSSPYQPPPPSPDL